MIPQKILLDKLSFASKSSFLKLLLLLPLLLTAVETMPAEEAIETQHSFMPPIFIVMIGNPWQKEKDKPDEA